MSSASCSCDAYCYIFSLNRQIGLVCPLLWKVFYYPALETLDLPSTFRKQHSNILAHCRNEKSAAEKQWHACCESGSTSAAPSVVTVTCVSTTHSQQGTVVLLWPCAVAAAPWPSRSPPSAVSSAIRLICVCARGSREISLCSCDKTLVTSVCAFT